MDRNSLLKKLRAERDALSSRGDHAEALILNDRIVAIKDGTPNSLSVERVMQQFESGLARRTAYGPRQLS